GVLILAARRFGLRHGRVFALYVAGYTLGRFWIEGLRVDPAHEILGLRLNQWTSIVIFLCAVAYLVLSRNRTGEEPVGVLAGDGEDADPAHGRDQADEPELGGGEAGNLPAAHEDTPETDGPAGSASAGSDDAPADSGEGDRAPAGAGATGDGGTMPEPEAGRR
ncbi:prolipoprotein diacylglyceryl transferase family protein, partial [Microbispora triticiradicis]|uniref:prolipoprotein diacylglyceryl transferase family protein n=1 Tax=Microbispora triticiradicis TaxID=2200763 RepID=UPI001AD6CA2C